MEQSQQLIPCEDMGKHELFGASGPGQMDRNPQGNHVQQELPYDGYTFVLVCHTFRVGLDEPFVKEFPGYVCGISPSS